MTEVCVLHYAHVESPDPQPRTAETSFIFYERERLYERESLSASVLRPPRKSHKAYFETDGAHDVIVNVIIQRHLLSSLLIY